MWYREVSLEVRREGALILDDSGGGPPCRLRAALFHWPDTAEGSSMAAEPLLEGIAWEGLSGGALWGWPDEGGRIALREARHDPGACSVSPPALSLALALRRARTDLGATVLVVGDGFLARLAAAVASLLGCRVRSFPGWDQGVCPEPEADVVIETSGDPMSLGRALRQCRDWGAIYSMGTGLSRAALDYYHDVHRRALTLHQVPVRPILLPGEDDVLEHGLPGLLRALRGVVPEADEALEVHIQPQGEIGRLVRERSGRWGHLVVTQP